MADNYLERRMEDLHSGRKTTIRSNSVYSARRSAGTSFGPSPKRVLIAGDITPIGSELILRFIEAGSKVAFIGHDNTTAADLSRGRGLRYYPIGAANIAAVENAVTDLLAAWRDIDILIIVGNPVNALPELLESLWCRHKQRYPIPTDSAPRIIIVSSTSNLPDASPESSILADTLLFLSLPRTGAIEQSTIFLPYGLTIRSRQLNY